MAKSGRAIPPPLELLCLNALWHLREGNVRQVREVVAESRPLAYTTIMTVLDRLVQKGRLSRRKVGRAFVYLPQTSRDAMRRTAVRELIDGFFDGSEADLLVFLGRTETDRQPAPAPAATATSREAPADQGIDTVLL